MRTLLALLCFSAFGFSQESKPLVPDNASAVKLRDTAFQAARNGDVKTLEEYFKQGHPINETNPRGDTLLIVAVYNGQAKAVDEILKQPKLDINAKNKAGFSALTAAAFKGHVEIAVALVKAKADVNLANASKQTPLMFAAQAGKTKMVEYLLKASADPKVIDASGETALSLAQTRNAKDIVTLLEKALAGK